MHGGLRSDKAEGEMAPGLLVKHTGTVEKGSTPVGFREHQPVELGYRWKGIKVLNDNENKNQKDAGNKTAASSS
jgi:hypothetical protein